MDEDKETLLTRRRLLATGAVVVVGATLSQATASARAYAAAATKAAPLARFARHGYGRSRFAPHVGGPVTLRSRGGAAVGATLLAVEDVPFVASLAGHEDVYTLRFGAAALLPEGVTVVRSKRFGAVDLYLTPAPAGAGAQDYLATVNRHIPRSARRAARAQRA